MPAGLLLFAAALWAFGSIAGEVMEGDALAFDRVILLALRNPLELGDPIGPRWVEQIALDMTSLGGVTVLTLITILALGFLLVARKHAAAVLLGASVFGGALLSDLLKRSFARPRPDLVPHFVEVTTASFPSGHAMLSAVTYLTLGALLARVQSDRALQAYTLSAALLLTILIGASRVYLGVHWPTDVIAGWCVGSAWAILCGSIALYLQRRGAVER